MKIPAVSVFQPQLPEQATTAFQPQLPPEASWGWLIELGDVIDRMTIPSEHLFHHLSKPRRQIRSQLVNRHAF
jgi:hypothetical protein